MRVLLFCLIYITNIFAIDTLTVAVHNFEPLVMQRDNGDYYGYEIDILKEISRENNIYFTYVPIDTFHDIFGAIDSGVADIAAAGITIKHSRAQKYDFSYPHMKTGCATLVRNESSIDIARAVKEIFIDNIALFLTYAGYLLLVSLIVYLLELRSDAFSDKPIVGLLQSFYFANTTATTTGYGDYAPKKPLSRFFVILFLFYPGIVFSGVIFGTISTAMEQAASSTLIQSKEELYTYKVATVQNTANVAVAQSLAKEVVEASSKDEAVNMLKNGAVDAVVFDASPLQYLAKKDGAITTVGGLYKMQDYGFMLPKDSPFTRIISMSVLKMYEEGKIEELEVKWLR